MKVKYDVVIIGSGLGGLICGAVLSKEGLSVCVLEKNDQAGGCFQNFKRFGVTLDTGIHYIGSLDEGEVQHRYFSYLGIMNRLNLVRLEENCFERLYFPDKAYDYAMGIRPFVDRLVEDFPGERDNLNRYMRSISRIADTISEDVLRNGKISAVSLESFTISAWDEIVKTTRNNRLREILSNPTMLYAGNKNSSMFYTHAMIASSYLHGSYRFIGSSMQLTDALIKTIEEQGGEVCTQAEVTAIGCKEYNLVNSIEVKGKDEIQTEYVISSLHPRYTAHMIKGATGIRKAYLTRLQSLPNSFGFFTVYLIKKKNTFKYINSNLYLYGGDNCVWYNNRLSKDTDIASVLVSMKPSDEKRKYTDVVELITPMFYDEVAQWKHTTANRRGAEYRDFKTRKAEQLIAFAKRYLPDIDANTEHIVTTTPLSYRDYTGTPEGSAYGIMKDYRNPLNTFIPIRGKVKNLYATGQNVNMHGVLGVTLTSLLTCAEIVGEEYLAKKIAGCD